MVAIDHFVENEPLIVEMVVEIPAVLGIVVVGIDLVGVDLGIVDLFVVEVLGKKPFVEIVGLGLALVGNSNWDAVSNRGYRCLKMGRTPGCLSFENYHLQPHLPVLHLHVKWDMNRLGELSMSKIRKLLLGLHFP